MEYITPGKMREIDRGTQEEFGIPAAILMESAGRAVFQTTMEMLLDILSHATCMVTSIPKESSLA